MTIILRIKDKFAIRKRKSQFNKLDHRRRHLDLRLFDDLLLHYVIDRVDLELSMKLNCHERMDAKHTHNFH